METRGLKVAVDYLNSFYPIALVPEELKKRAGCNIMVDTLARKLRANTNRMEPEKGRVIVSYDLDERGEKVAFYGGNPGFKFEDRKKPTRLLGIDPGKPGSDRTVYRVPAVFFYAIEGKGMFSFSQYYNNREDMEKKLVEVKAACGTELFKFPTYTGSHDNPVRL